MEHYSSDRELNFDFVLAWKHHEEQKHHKIIP